MSFLFKYRYSTYIKVDSDTKVASWTDDADDDMNAAQKAAYVSTFKTAADKVAEVELVTATVNIRNFSDNDVAIASYADAASYNAANVAKGTETIKTNTTIFVATANGTVLPCAVNTSNLPAKASAAVPVTVYVAAPVNSKEITLTISIPGADASLEYTLENDNYVDFSKL